MKRRLCRCLCSWLAAWVMLALAAGCDHPFAPAEDPRSPVPAQPLPEKSAPNYLSHEEMMNVYDYLVATFHEARDHHAQISQQKKAGDQNWMAGWNQWQIFAENQGRIMEVKRGFYETARYQAAPGNPAPCLYNALVQLNSLINYYSRNLSQDFPLGPDADANFQADLAPCKQLLDNYEPSEEFSGTPPPKIK